MQELNKTFLDFIEIGTCDFDTEIQKDDGKVGISIDAVNFYLNRLPNKKNCIKINSGVSDYSGTIKINYVPLENIIKYNLPEFIKGCSSVNNYHPTVTKILEEKALNNKDVTATVSVPCEPLVNILKKYRVKGFYFLKIDTEGHDYLILRHFLKNYKDKTILPHKILFESNALSDKKNVLDVIKLAQDIGYDLISHQGNTILKLNIKKNRSKNFRNPNKIINYCIEEYPKGYNSQALPHGNNYEDAKNYCIKNDYAGVTFQNGNYEVRDGKYINYSKGTISWCYI
tara:strand:+ start:753 stop:1607 length:855 start_codon:yes stop_codon:yes gene_type:complete